MNKPIFLFFASLLCCVAVSAQETVTVTEAQALAAVKNLRGETTSTANFFIGTVNEVIADPLHPLDSALCAPWLLSSQVEKWVVFADENSPTAASPYACYYLPKTVESGTVTPLYEQPFYFVPSSPVLTALEINQQYPAKTLITQRPTIGNQNATTTLRSGAPASGTRAIIIGATNELEFWNDCSYLYQVLLYDYNVPKSNITIHFGDGTDNQTLITPDNYSTSPCPVPFDFDTDGYDETVFPSNYPSIDSTFYALAENDSINVNHLFVFIVGNADECGDIYLNNSYLYPSILKESLSYREYPNTTIVMCSSRSGKYIDELAKTNTVVITATNKYNYIQNNPNYPYTAFGYAWINALNGRDFMTGGICGVSSPISMRTAYDNAITSGTSGQSPQYMSIPSSWGTRLYINQYPKDIDVYIRDNESDDGSEPNGLNGYHWLSPDIWASGSGFAPSPTNEQLMPNNSGYVFISVRVTNRGSEAFSMKDDDPVIPVDIYWVRKGLGLHQDATYPNTSMYGLVGSIPMDISLAAGQSCVHYYSWHVPDSLRLEAEEQGVLALDFLAVVGDPFLPTPMKGLTKKEVLARNDVAVRKSVRINPYMGTYVAPIDPSTEEGHYEVSMPIYISTPENVAYPYNLSYRFIIMGDSAETNSSIFPISIRAYGDLLAEYFSEEEDENGDYYVDIDQTECIINELELTESNVERIVLKFCVPAGLLPNNLDKNIHVMLQDYAYRVIDGMTVNLSYIGMAPGEHRAPGITTTTGDDGSCLLEASNVTEATECEWFNSSGKAGEGTSLSLAGYQARGKYTLRAIDRERNTTGFASVDLGAGNSLLSVSRGSGQLSVELSRAASVNTVVRLTHLSNVNTSMDYPVGAGETGLLIATNDWQAGVYVVSLFENNKLVDSKQIIINP